MANVAVVGVQWGDEGKGKIVDWLSHRADVVVRFQGGHNAGHTLVVDGVTYKLSLLPSGVVRGGKLSVIGSGVVIDPWALAKEMDTLRASGVEISPETLMIAENASLILPLHRDLDALREDAAGVGKIGTTRRGIGPAYEDKVGRRAVRVIDLADEDALADRVTRLLAHHNPLRRGLGEGEIAPEEVMAPLREIASTILPFSRAVWRELDGVRRAGRRVLFEGAQGTLLDVDHGTYPFVTSSHTVAGQAAAGSGVGPRSIGYVLGIAKAYTTRVGSGPFPTEQDNEIGQVLGEKGHEFGTVTGRSRRCGWFDAVLARQSLTIGGVDGIAFTKLDVLDGMKEIRICTAYRLNGEVMDRLPAGARSMAAVEPVYETVPGWSGSTKGARSWADLPAEAVKYVRRVEELIGKPVAMLSTSPEREDVILMRDPFEG